MVRRSDFVMRLDMLEVLSMSTAINPKMVTHLMRDCNMEIDAVRAMATDLCKLDLLKETENRDYYITPNGLQLVQFYRIIKERLGLIK